MARVDLSWDWSMKKENWPKGNCRNQKEIIWEDREETNGKITENTVNKISTYQTNTYIKYKNMSIHMNLINPKIIKDFKNKLITLSY